MKFVALSLRLDFYDDRNELREGVDQKLISWLSFLGLTAIPISNSLAENALPQNTDASQLDNLLDKIGVVGIVLSGGNNLGTYPNRDQTELNLLNYAENKNLPVLGICRGMQLMASRAGVDVMRVNGHANCEHLLNGEICGSVMSYHDFAIKKCPRDYRVLAQSEDGSIEAIRHKSLPWEGWMWHPERRTIFSEQDTQRTKDIFSI